MHESCKQKETNVVSFVSMVTTSPGVSIHYYQFIQVCCIFYEETGNGMFS